MKTESNATSHDSLLKECATDTLPELVRHELQQYANKQLITACRLGISGSTGGVAPHPRASIDTCIKTIDEIGRSSLAFKGLTSLEKKKKAKLRNDLAGGNWRKTFKGRDILRQFAGKYVRYVRYEVFRDLIIARMKDAGFQPPGMKRVVQKMLDDP